MPLFFLQPETTLSGSAVSSVLHKEDESMIVDLAGNTRLTGAD
jgi:hypothetical protein